MSASPVTSGGAPAVVGLTALTVDGASARLARGALGAVELTEAYLGALPEAARAFEIATSASRFRSCADCDQLMRRRRPRPPRLDRRAALG